MGAIVLFPAELTRMSSTGVRKKIISEAPVKSGRLQVSLDGYQVILASYASVAPHIFDSGLTDEKLTSFDRKIKVGGWNRSHIYHIILAWPDTIHG